MFAISFMYTLPTRYSVVKMISEKETQMADKKNDSFNSNCSNP